MLQLIVQNPLLGLLVAAVLLMSLVLHELGHALVADWSGDPTPRQLGRITLNPLRHLDLFGTLLLLLVGFGYARPVITQPQLYRYRWSFLAVSVAGIVVNLILALLAVFLIRVLPFSRWLVVGLQYIFAINVALAVFNALPIPPLDGSHILAALIPGPLGLRLRNTTLPVLVFYLALILLLVPIQRLIGAVQGGLYAWLIAL